MITLPIDAYLSDIIQQFKKSKNLILKASPGSGKTTRLPAALLKSGLKKIIVLVPKRIAAVSAADRIAEENDWILGDQVGYQVRFESLCKPSTELIFMTEGLFIKKAQSEKFWNSLDIIIFDEFHERSSLADMALGLALEKQILFERLKLIVMSATLDSKTLEQYLPDCVTIQIKAPPFPLELFYTAKPQRLICDTEFFTSLVGTVDQAWSSGLNDILVFLPGVSEMRKAETAINKKYPVIPIQILHGSLKLSEQREILKTQNFRRIILTTDIAESSLTIPGVDAVIDCGLKKNSVKEPKLGFSQLLLNRISMFSAEQRAGRAARVRAGRCYRLWHESDERSMPMQIKPEILKSDLLEEILALKSCKVDSISDFMWLDPPPKRTISEALKKLQTWKLLGQDEKITPLGQNIQQLPLGIERALLFYFLASYGFQKQAATLLAALETVDFSKAFADKNITAEDDLERILSPNLLPPQGLKIKSQLENLNLPVLKPGTNFIKTLIHIFFTNFPEKISQKKSEQEALSSGGRGVSFKLFLQARQYDYQILLNGYNASERTDIYFAVGFSKAEFLEHSTASLEFKTAYSIDFERRQIFKVLTKKIGSFIISESSRQGLTSTEEALAWPLIAVQDQEILLEAHDDFKIFQQKINFLKGKINIEFTMDDDLKSKIFADLSTGVRSLEQFLTYPLKDLLQLYLPEAIRKIFSQLPDFLTLPSGRTVHIDYVSEKAPMISAKIQDFYGLKETPTLLDSKLPLTLQLLAPSLRPTQITQNLKLFWEKSYFEIRKELRARYPKQQWPDNPADYILEKKK